MIPGQDAALPPLTRRLLSWEIIIVFAVSLGGSALTAIISLIGSLTAHKTLGHQAAVLAGSAAPGRPLLDLSFQLAGITLALAPVALVFYLMARAGEPLSAMGLDTSQPGRDLARGAVLAAIIGGVGLGLYLTAYRLGLSLNVVPESLPPVWWRVPVLVLIALQNGVLEEILVLGYLLRRLEQLGWRPAAAIAVSALLRGSYHLYQGFGGFLGNAAMGALFGVLFLRWRRVTPMIIAHGLIDTVAFLGYLGLHGRVAWLP